MKFTVFYSVQNGGDGSAYPRFMESAELAAFDQRHLFAGWGEDCSGSISFESDSPITCLKEIITKESYLIEHYYGDVDNGVPYNNEECKKFMKKFFPNGLPHFTVKVEPGNKYVYNQVFVDDKQVARIFRETSKSGKVFEDFLNSMARVD